MSVGPKNIHHKSGGAWQNPVSVHRNDVDSWKEADDVYRKYNGAWEKVHTRYDFEYAITSDVYDFNLLNEVTTDNGNAPIAAVSCILMLGTNIRIGSTSTAIPAIDLTGLPLGSTVDIVMDESYVVGCGGGGGAANGGAGSPGGPALKIDANTIVSLTGSGGIFGGGGGGGAGGRGATQYSYSCNCYTTADGNQNCSTCYGTSYHTGGAPGGGGGYSPGDAGSGSGTAQPGQSVIGNGTGGLGGSDSNSKGSNAGYGGDGGNVGQVGQAGQSGNSTAGGNGGSPGYAVDGYSYCIIDASIVLLGGVNG